MDQVNLGLVGGGTVGGGVWQALQRNGDLMAARLGVRLNVARMAVRDPKRTRGFTVPASVLTGDWSEVVHDPKVQIVVELMGGITTAREVVRAALKLGKPVVTANKALLSAHGPELFALAAKHGTNLYYEAAVAGGIPIIKALRESFAGNRITRIAGIVNGTCNYILTRMKLEGAEFSEVLADAQRLGYAEAEPSLDIDGHDAAHKIGILASLAHGFWVRPETIHTEGIRHISKLDIQFAGQLGYTIRLLGIIQPVASPAPAAAKKGKKAAADGQASGIQVSVYPALVPNTHVLASVNHAFNAVAVRGDTVGDTLFYGRGAGQDPTASSVLGDLADAALDLRAGNHHRVPPFVTHNGQGKVASLDTIASRFYVRLDVSDRPGVFARIATVLARAKIGISSIIQPEGHTGETVPVILMLDAASNLSVRRALATIGKLPVVKSKPVMLRVENLD
jgi:homoserine dehydrogenase